MALTSDQFREFVECYVTNYPTPGWRLLKATYNAEIKEVEVTMTRFEPYHGVTATRSISVTEMEGGIEQVTKYLSRMIYEMTAELEETTNSEVKPDGKCHS